MFFHHLFARCHASVAIRSWVRPAIFAAGCTHTCTLSGGSCYTWMNSTGNFCCGLPAHIICTLTCDSCNTWILPAISAAGCGYLQLNYIWLKHLAWQKWQFTFSILWRCRNATAARSIKFALTSNRQKHVVTTVTTVRIIKLFPHLSVSLGSNDAQHMLLSSCRLLKPSVLS